MKSKNKSFYAHGNEHKTSKPSKHDANLQKNSVLHFQIGLLIGLIVTFFVLQIALKPLPAAKQDFADVFMDEEIYVLDPIVQREEPKQEETKKVNPITLIDVYKKIDNDTEITAETEI